MRAYSVILLFCGIQLGIPSLNAQSINGWTPELAMQVKRIGGVVPSADGRLVVYQVGTAIMDEETSEWRTQLHLARADGSGSRQLTRGEHSATAPSWSPDRFAGRDPSRANRAP